MKDMKSTDNGFWQLNNWSELGGALLNFSNYDADFVYSHQETFTVADVHRRGYGIGLCMWGPWVISMLCRCADIMVISHQGSCYLCAYSRRLCLKALVIFKAVQMMFSCNGEMQMSYTLSELQHWYIILFIWFLYWTYDLTAYEMFTSYGIYDC